MTPSARLQAAIEVLGELERTDRPADRFLRDWFRARRYAGAKDRASVGEQVFQVLRHRASLAWRMSDDSPRALVIASVGAEGGDVECLFDGSHYGPAPLTQSERAALAHARDEAPPLWVQGEFPEFLEGELNRRFGANLLEEMRAMTERATIDLRANTLKASRDQVLREVRSKGFAAEPTPYAPHGIRIAQREGAAALSRTRAFLEGRFEFQDEAAQIASLLCAAKPGECILDLAAGAGGKALALASQMQDCGLIVARDRDQTRLAQLAPRAVRAGATIIREFGNGPFDAVLVDAPCSGSGAWRRQPEQKWRLTPERLTELQSIQEQLLDEAVLGLPASGRPSRPGKEVVAREKNAGGTPAVPGERPRIVYATCSLLACENEDCVSAFLARHPDYFIRPAAEIWHEVTNTAPPPDMDDFFHASPRSTGTDGFFTAVLARRE